MYRIICYTLAFLLLSTPSALHAYGLRNIGNESVVPNGVLIADVELDQAAYTAGDTAVLTFALKNTGETVQQGLMYRVDLVGTFDEATGLPASRFVMGEVTTVPALSLQQIHSVTVRSMLPAYAPASDLGFAVSVFNAATELVAQEHVRMLVTGTRTPSVTYIAQVQVDGEPFDLAAGPTAYTGEQAAFAVSLKSSRGTYSLTPFVEVYEGFAPLGTPRTSFEGEMVPVGTGRSTEQRMILPTFDYTPGVYTALITYKDSEGISYAGPFVARYVVAGGTPTLRSALPTKLEVSSEEAFDVVVSYVDPPKNISLEATVDPASYTGNMEAAITIVDAKNSIVGQQRVSFLPGKTKVSVPFTAPYYMYGMRIVTYLYEDGVQVDMLDVVLPDVHSIVAEVPTSEEQFIAKHGQLLVGIGALLIIIVGAAWVIARRWGK